MNLHSCTKLSANFNALKSLATIRLQTTNTPTIYYSEKPKPEESDIIKYMQELPSQVQEFTDPEWRSRNADKKAFTEIRYDHRFIAERHDILGPDLAAAHFIVHRGGKVKFLDHDHWITQDKNGKYILPDKFIPDLYLEAIDASEMPILFESFDNLINLTKLRYLNVSKCQFVDDWCLSRLHIFSESLLYLNVNSCHQVSEKGLSVLHNLSQLQRLEMLDLPKVRYRELTAIMVQEMLPSCFVMSIDYTDRLHLDNFVEHPWDLHLLEEKSSLWEERLKLLPNKDNVELIANDDVVNFDRPEGHKDLQVELLEGVELRDNVNRVYIEMLQKDDELLADGESRRQIATSEEGVKGGTKLYSGSSLFQSFFKNRFS